MAAPIALKGATEISLDPRGETSDFYADDMFYYTTCTNAGYEATLTVANIHNEFRTDVLGEEIETTDNVLTEQHECKDKTKLLSCLNLMGIKSDAAHVYTIALSQDHH